MNFVIGLDSGGTHTRIAAVDLTGKVLAYIKGKPGNPEQNPDAEQNIQNLIRQVINEAGGHATDVHCLVAGLAGLNGPEDLEWAQRYTNDVGEHCMRYHMNDTVVAHRGALISKPGIVAISGTGWNVFGITETQRNVNSTDLAHFSGGGAWHLASGVIHEMIATGIQSDNKEFIHSVLTHLRRPTLESLREDIISLRSNGSPEFGSLVRSICPLVTEAAKKGVPLAESVCMRIVSGMVLGIKLLGSCFESDVVTVSLMGSVLRSSYIKRQTELSLAMPSCREFKVVDPKLSGTAGAVLIALQKCGVRIDDSLIATLSLHPMAGV